ncbi:MAG TPA: hypothetical protein PKN70_04640 [Smithellaceae bacterium]|nr:hypothetical protein [Smithellaceae bacterium]HQM45254.1 hypothetical protein [Smithellaceae bacterium]
MTRFEWLQKKWITVLLLLCFWPVSGVLAWSEHPLITYPVASSMPEMLHAQPVIVESLESFISAEEKKLEFLLAEEEEWAGKNLQWYAPLPLSLVFKANGNRDDARLRFCHAIRINPAVKIPLYFQRLPGETPEGKSLLPLQAITFLREISDWNGIIFDSVNPGDTVRPLDIVVSASDEPDLLGLDIGLFEDNDTDFGKQYGFGTQPFGNPHLEYGSQAPFHMGFYHEAQIIYAFAGFLKKTYPEYRIHLYKRLAQLAFQTGHPYWGWRFTGWGLHYLADLTQPYHTTVLPGVCTACAIWINTVDMIGFQGPKANAIQLVSNRHAAIEKFVQVILQRAYREKEKNNPILAALQSSGKIPAYKDMIPRDVIAKAAHEKADELDDELEKYMPKQFVSDPEFELGTSAAREQIVEKIKMEKGQAAVDKLISDVSELLVPFATYGQSYIYSILHNGTETEK